LEEALKISNYKKLKKLRFGIVFAEDCSEEAGMIKMISKSKKNLKKHFRTIGISGVLCSWTTMAFVWFGLATASYVSYCLTAGLFGLAIMVGKS